MVHMLSYYIVTTLLQCSKQNIFISVLGIYIAVRQYVLINILLIILFWNCCHNVHDLVAQCNVRGVA